MPWSVSEELVAIKGDTLLQLRNERHPHSPEMDYYDELLNYPRKIKVFQMVCRNIITLGEHYPGLTQSPHA